VRRARLLPPCALGALVLSATSVARAGIEDTFALGPGPMALAGSYAARPGDYAAVYYNPAGLAPGGRVVEKGGFFEASFALVYGTPSLYVMNGHGQTLPTPPVYDTAGALIGARFSVGQPFHLDGLNMGLSLYVPSHVFQWNVRPDDTVQWALLSDRTQVLTFNAGLAYRVARWLSLGAGLRLTFDVETNINGVLTSFNSQNDKATTQLGTSAAVYGRVAPLAGILVTPVDRLRLGLTYRGESYIDDWGTAVIATAGAGLGNLGYDFRFAHYFEPTQLTMAVGADLGAGVDVSFDLTYANWAAALSDNRNLFGCGLAPCNGASPIWGDTWTPAFGAKWQASQAFALMAGYRFQKSPLDNFGGPSNLLDNDRHVPSLGMSFDVSKYAPSLDVRLTAGIQYVILDARTEVKSYQRFPSDAALDQNPGYPSYSYGGHEVAGSIGADARW
jgi:long-subunit fatty acid transport protein